MSNYVFVYYATMPNYEADFAVWPSFLSRKNFTYEFFEEEYLLLVIEKSLILNKSEYTLCIFRCESGFKKNKSGCQIGNFSLK